MGSPLEVSRVAFQREDPDDGTSPVATRSTVVDLHGALVRAIYSPPGHALGAISLTTAMTPDGVPTAVPIDLADGDETATMIRFADDLPLMQTWVTVEHVRDEPFELFFVYEHRG